MTSRARHDGFILLALCSTLFLLASLAMARTPSATVVDFKAVYYGARCVIHHVNPYDEQEFLRVYRAEGGDREEDSVQQRKVVTTFINLPTGLLVIAPFAILPWSVAHVLWVALIALLITCAVWLIWSQVADSAPILSAVLLSIFLLTSIMLVDVGNTAGLVVALIGIAVCLLLESRYIAVGAVCLAVSLVIKPHDAGFIWLFFLLGSSVQRKRALYSLIIAVAIGLPGIAWMSHTAPHWMTDLHHNLTATSGRGDINDPGPTSASAHSADFIVDLQTVLSVFWDEPGFYNTVSVVITAPLIAFWIVLVVRAHGDSKNAWLLLAAISALTVLPIYHRQDDARIILLTIPACGLLWRERGRVGKLAAALTLSVLLLNGDLTTVLRTNLTRPLLASAEGTSRMIMTVLLDRPVPLCLLGMGVLYLLVLGHRVFWRDRRYCMQPNSVTET